MFTKTETLRRLRVAAKMIRDHEGLAPNTRAELGTADAEPEWIG